jgi:hypothetical protein
MVGVANSACLLVTSMELQRAAKKVVNADGRSAYGSRVGFGVFRAGVGNASV